jgi:predicted lipid-binding transport protein (Tim44 family)
VTVHLNPFDKSDPVLKIDLALYQLFFIVLMLGVLIGGCIVWLNRLRRRGSVGERSGDIGPAPARGDRSEQRRREQHPARASAYLPRPERS